MSPLSIHGSSESGHCSNTSVTMDGGQVCNSPQSSVLFDGVIPSLTGRNNNTCWASQLLVLGLGGTITFEFSPPGSGTLNNIEAFEIIMLNCPQELMGAPLSVTRRSDCSSSNIVIISSSLTAPTCSLTTTSRVNTHFKGMSLGNQISLYSFVNVIVCTLVKA